jgi:LysM repeat protein
MADRAAQYMRFLAPVALGLFAVVLIAVILGGLGGSSSSDSGGRSASQSVPGKTAPSSPRRRGRGGRKATYTVKAGDSLGSISQSTGKTPQNLQDYNPGLDPQSLQPGQKLKLRG